MPPSLVSLPESEAPLDDVYEEALDDAEDLCWRLESCFQDAEHTLDSFAAGPERKLFGALEVLVVDAAADRKLLRELLESPESPSHAQAAAMVLLRLDERELVAKAARQSDAAARAPIIRACSLLRDEPILHAAQRALEQERDPAIALPAMELVAAYRASAPPLEHWLRQDDPSLLVAALRVLPASDPLSYRAWIESLLRYPHETVHELAIMAGLACHAPSAFAACEASALSERHFTPEAMALYAALGGPAHHQRLAGLLDSPAHRRHVLFALGYSGNVATVPSLIPLLDHAEPIVAKLAFEAISTLTGLDVGSRVFARAATASTPEELAPMSDAEEAVELSSAVATDEEDAAHEFVDDLAHPDRAAVAHWWAQSSASYAPNVRWLGGEPFTAAAAARFLARAPLRRRHALAQALCARTRGGIVLDTHALSRWQRAQQAQVATLAPRQLSTPLSSF